MVSRRKRREAHFVVASFGKSALNSGNNVVSGTLAHRTIHHARLAETASTRATTQNFNVQAVMHEFRERHHSRLPGRRGREIFPNALHDIRGHILVFRAHPCACLLRLVLIKHIVERRHIAALQMRSSAQKLSARRARLLHFPMKNEQFGKRLFTFAQQKHVEKR